MFGILPPRPCPPPLHIGVGPKWGSGEAGVCTPPDTQTNYLITNFISTSASPLHPKTSPDFPISLTSFTSTTLNLIAQGVHHITTTPPLPPPPKSPQP